VAEAAPSTGRNRSSMSGMWLIRIPSADGDSPPSAVVQFVALHHSSAFVHRAGLPEPVSTEPISNHSQKLSRNSGARVS
jgi:hypothetical protein